MNILFVSMFQVSEEKGGTERTTARISNELRRRGYKCYNLYNKPIDSALKRTEFDSVYNQCSVASIVHILNKHSIDKIIIEGAFVLTKNVYKAKLLSKGNPQIYFVHHFAPGFEPYFNAFYSLKKQFLYSSFLSNQIKSLVKIITYPIYKPYMDNLFRRLYKTAYDYCDKIVLLSSDYEKDYCRFGNIKDTRKFTSIPNAISFDDFLDYSDIEKKQNTVLIVSRFDEVQKRISQALRIWKLIENDEDLTNWNLKLVGFGESESDYKKLVKLLNLKRVSFEGRQNPINYYKDSFLFMMTSLFEGWPMTLNESLQFGCIPIVYDTCASFHEIIIQGENGFLINDGNEQMFYKTMKTLMIDKDKRKTMSIKAIDSSKRFTLEKIVSQWEKLLNDKI